MLGVRAALRRFCCFRLLIAKKIRPTATRTKNRIATTERRFVKRADLSGCRFHSLFAHSFHVLADVDKFLLGVRRARNEVFNSLPEQWADILTQSREKGFQLRVN